MAKITCPCGAFFEFEDGTSHASYHRDHFLDYHKACIEAAAKNLLTREENKNKFKFISENKE